MENRHLLHWVSDMNIKLCFEIKLIFLLLLKKDGKFFFSIEIKLNIIFTIYISYHLYTSLFYSNSNNLVVPIQNFKTTYMIEKLKGFF